MVETRARNDLRTNSPDGPTVSPPPAEHAGVSHWIWIDEAPLTEAQLEFLYSEVRIHMTKKKPIGIEGRRRAAKRLKGDLDAADRLLAAAILEQGKSRLLIPEPSRADESRASKVIQLRARAAERVTAARWYAQPKGAWPDWWGAVVRSSSMEGTGYLLLPNGHIQALTIGDWLVKRASGRVDAMSNDAFLKTFEEDRG